MGRLDHGHGHGLADGTSPDPATPADSGFVAVPAKPTAAMVAEGARAGAVSLNTAWQVYQAMLRQAPEEAGDRTLSPGHG